jgi:protocatechuate 3,4-dioxygenase beta subunit
MTRRQPRSDSTPETGNEAVVTRRTAVHTGVVGVAALAFGTISVQSARAGGPAGGPAAGNLRELELTPSCTDGDETPRNIEGPFFKRNSPLRTDLRTPGVSGVLLNLTGIVYDRRCRVVPGVLLEFWQADARGAYDNRGYTLRGHQFTTDTGSYTLATVVPRDYRSGGTRRTPHMHVKVQAPRGPVLTTQLFFPDDTRAYGLDFARLNARDSFIDRRCTIALTAITDGYTGVFDFAIALR